MLTHNKKEWLGGGWLPLIILTIPLFFVLPNAFLDTRMSKQVMCEWSVICFGVLFFLRNNKWLKYFVLWAFFRYALQFFYSVYPLAISGHLIRASYTSFNTVFFFSVLYESVRNISFSKERVYDSICILCLVQCCFMILQMLGVWFMFKPTDLGVIGLFTNTNMTGSFIALCLPCFFRKKWVYCIPIPFFFLIVTKCEGALIPAILCAFTYAYFMFKKKSRVVSYVLPIAAVISIGYFVNMYMHNGLGSLKIRFMIWKWTFSGMISNLPLVGYGLGNFKLLMPMISKYEYGYAGANGICMQAHNEFIQLLAELGMIGLVICLSFLIKLIIKGIKRKEWIALAGMSIAIVNANVNFLFHTVVCVLPLTYFVIIDHSEPL